MLNHLCNLSFDSVLIIPCLSFTHIFRLLRSWLCCIARLRRIKILRIYLLSRSLSCAEFHSSPWCSTCFLCEPSRRMSWAPPVCLLHLLFASSVPRLLSWLCCIAPCFYHPEQPFPLSSNQFLLSSPALCFTSFSFALYSSLHRCFSRSVHAPSILSVASFPSWIFPAGFGPRASLRP